MGYIYLFNCYCFTYEHFEELIKMNRTRKSDILEWMYPLIEDKILINWLSSLNSAKASELVKLIEECQSTSKSTDSNIKRLCLEIELT